MGRLKEGAVASTLLFTLACSANSPEPAPSTPTSSPDTVPSEAPCHSSLGQVALVDQDSKIFEVSELFVPTCVDDEHEPAPIYAADDKVMTSKARIVGWLAKGDRFAVTCLNFRPNVVGVKSEGQPSGIALHENPVFGQITEALRDDPPSCMPLPPPPTDLGDPRGKGAQL